MKNLTAWDLFGLALVATIIVSIFALISLLTTPGHPASDKRFQKTRVGSAKRCYVQIDDGKAMAFVKAEIENHVYYVFELGRGQQAIMHSPACTGCVVEVKEQMPNINWGEVLRIPTNLPPSWWCDTTNGVLLL